MEQFEKALLKQREVNNKHDEDIEIIFEALKRLLKTDPEPRKRIGFKPE